MGTYNRESSEVGSLQRSGMDLRFGTLTNKKCFFSESGAVSARSRVKLLSRDKWCCCCLFTCLLELHPAVLGTLSVAQIKINGFSMTAELTEHIRRAGCAARLSPTPTTPQQFWWQQGEPFFCLPACWKPARWPYQQAHHRISAAMTQLWPLTAITRASQLACLLPLRGAADRAVPGAGTRGCPQVPGNAPTTPGAAGLCAQLCVALQDTQRLATALQPEHLFLIDSDSRHHEEC
ncbi:uncharacterized protein LOC142603684 isoform X3 [Balearica regulorum gibbericeps]